jgi:hypothetical protein
MDDDELIPVPRKTLMRWHEVIAGRRSVSDGDGDEYNDDEVIDVDDEIMAFISRKT